MIKIHKHEVFRYLRYNSRKIKSRGPSPRERPDDRGRCDDGDGWTTARIRRRGRGAPLGLGSLDLVYREAALAADLITF